jgi:hypothetical protein
MAALRRTLVDDQAGNPYIASVPRWGYGFVATRSRVEEALPVAASAAAAREEPTHNLPMPATRTMGRAKIIASLVSYLPRWRSITLVGPRDIGKTTVALAVVETLRAVHSRRCEESLRC